MEFDLQLVLDTLKKKRKIFVSEADFQLELAWEIKKAYTIMLTNDLCYTKEPGRDNSAYQAFSLAEDSIKTGTLNWKVGSKTGEVPQVNKPIVLSGSYKMHWQEYSRLDDTNTGTFKYVINEIN